MSPTLNRWLRVAALAFALVLTGCGEDAVPMTPLSGTAVVLAFGDSLTFGTGAKPETSYPAHLEGMIGRKVVRSGVPGEVSIDGLARLAGELEKHEPRLVILCHGGNDILRKQNLAKAEQNLRQMIAMIKGTGAQVLLIGVPKPSLSLDTAEHYDRIAQDLGLPYVRDALGEILGDRSLKADSVHPNGAGYRRLAEIIAEYLKEARAVG